jgi:hypothetical protein
VGKKVEQGVQQVDLPVRRATSAGRANVKKVKACSRFDGILLEPFQVFVTNKDFFVAHQRIYALEKKLKAD